MFGFLVGTLSLIGLIKVWRWGRYGHGRRGYGGPRRWMLRRLFEHLDTTPGQEKVIAGAVEDAERKLWAAREELLRGRAAFAKAMRGERFEGAAIDAAFERQQAAVDEVKKAVKEGMAALHEALTAEQRARLANLLEFGPARMHGCGHGHFRHEPHRRGGDAQAVNL